MKLARLVGVALLAAALPRAGGASALSPAAARTWDVDRGTGAILIEDHRAPLVEIRLMFPVGRWSPWYRRARVADEAFFMQPRDPAGRLRARADRLGVDLALTTDARMSMLSLGCTRDVLDSAVALVRDVLDNRDLDQGEIKRRNVQRDLEYSAGDKNPGTLLSRTVRRALLERDDPRRLPYEKRPHVSNDLKALLAARDTLVRWPGRVVGLAGDLSPAEAERVAASILPPPLASPPAPGTPALPPFAKHPEAKTVTLGRLTQVYLGLVRDAPALEDPDYPAFLIADHVLGGHFYSRLYLALRHGAGDTYATGTYRELEPAPGVTGPWTYSRTANAAVAETKLRDVLETFHDRGITESERADAAGYFVGRLSFNVQSPAQVLERLLWERSRGLTPRYRERLVVRASEIPLATINDFVRRFYDPARFVAVRVKPK
jgi:zinc protease